MADEKTERSIVEALLEASAYKKGNENRREVAIRRKDKVLFEFTIEPLNEDEWRQARRQNLKNRGKRNEELDGARFLSQLIYEATIEEDKNRLWRNKEVQIKLNAASGTDVVNAVLTPAEKGKIAEVLEEISGYSEENLDDMIKN